jgi:hypothetical protein
MKPGRLVGQIKSLEAVNLPRLIILKLSMRVPAASPWCGPSEAFFLKQGEIFIA